MGNRIYSTTNNHINRFETHWRQSHDPSPKITETRWPNGWKMYVASNGVVNYMLRKFIKPSDLPYFEAGVTTHLLFDDRSKD